MRVAGRKPNPGGFSLIEAVVSVGVLAVAAPLVMAAMMRASESSALARAESRSPSMVSECLEEIGEAREGDSRLLDPIPPSGAFPVSGSLAAIAFTAEGRVVGRIEKEDYEKGVGELDSEAVRYIVRIDGEPEQVRDDGRPMRSVRMAIEYPAKSPAKNRRSLDFYSRIP
jgi:Tfp pilus assembly protein PilV